MHNFFEDDEVIEEIEELYSFIPDVQGQIDQVDETDSIYEDLEDENLDIDF